MSKRIAYLGQYYEHLWTCLGTWTWSRCEHWTGSSYLNILRRMQKLHKEEKKHWKQQLYNSGNLLRALTKMCAQNSNYVLYIFNMKKSSCNMIINLHFALYVVSGLWNVMTENLNEWLLVTFQEKSLTLTRWVVRDLLCHKTHTIGWRPGNWTIWYRFLGKKERKLIKNRLQTI